MFIFTRSELEAILTPLMRMSSRVPTGSSHQKETSYYLSHNELGELMDKAMIQLSILLDERKLPPEQACQEAIRAAIKQLDDDSTCVTSKRIKESRIELEQLRQTSPELF